VIALFLMTAGVSMATMVLLSLWVTRREHVSGLRRLTGKRTPSRQPSRTASGPVLMQATGGERAKIAASLLARFQLRERAERLLETADLKWGAVGLIHRSAGAALLASLAVLLVTRNTMPLVTLAAAVLGAVVPVKWVARKARARVAQFEEQFPECLEFISRSMRAGHAFSVSLEMVHKEFSEPLAGEFRRTFEEQKRTGGNLAELLDKLADIIRQRFKLRARIRAISAQGLMSGRILASIPAAVGCLMFVVNPQYARFFVDDPAGHEMLAAAFALQIVGYMIIKQIVTFEV